jgi:hypothetical protein
VGLTLAIEKLFAREYEKSLAQVKGSPQLPPARISEVNLVLRYYEISNRLFRSTSWFVLWDRRYSANVSV